MSLIDLFPQPETPVAPTPTPKHRGEYNRVVDIVRKNSTVVPARHSSEPDTMRAVFPR